MPKQPRVSLNYASIAQIADGLDQNLQKDNFPDPKDHRARRRQLLQQKINIPQPWSRARVLEKCSSSSDSSE